MVKRALPELFEAGRKVLIGVVHLRPLPGSPRWDGNRQNIIDGAVADARAYETGGADAVVIENFGDLPFTPGVVAPETVAAMAVAGQAVREAIGLPIGFNVLRNDGRSGLALCASCGGSFIRVNVLTGAMLTDQGLIEGDAYTIMRVRRQLCPDVAVLADVHVKHAVPLANWPLEQAARDTLERGLADGLIVSGTGTGLATDPADVATVRRACPQARILVGSGTTLENVAGLLPYVDGVIVGTSLKRSGRVEEAVDSARVAALAKTLR